MNELIKIEEKDGQKLVSARELHEFLQIRIFNVELQREVGTRYNDWIKNRIQKYGFIENEDYTLVTKILVTNNPKNPTCQVDDYAITIGMAKELCMVENNELGRQARKYFIECEKKLNQISTRDQLLLGLFSKDPIVVKECHEKLLELETAPLKQEIEVKTLYA